MLISRQAEEVKLQAKFQVPVRLQLLETFQLLANLPQVRKQLEVEVPVRTLLLAAAAE